MDVTLTISERLQDLRNERGLTLEQLAAETGLSSSALGSYEKNEDKDISHTAVLRLAKYYGVTTDYLLGQSEQKNYSDADIRGLRLSDGAIELLRSGGINHRLLCELMCHKDFARFLTDVEICVDRIVDMRINDYNVYLAAVREELIRKRQSDDADLDLRALELAQVNADDYFRHVLTDDLWGMVSDLQIAHKDDRSTADEASPASGAAQRLKDALDYEGSKEEKQVRVFLSQLGIDYDALTKEELVTQMRILNKSKHLKNPKGMRGKTRKKK